MEFDISGHHVVVQAGLPPNRKPGRQWRRGRLRTLPGPKAEGARARNVTYVGDK